MAGHAAQWVLVVTETEEMIVLTWKDDETCGVGASQAAADQHSHSQSSLLQHDDRPRKPTFLKTIPFFL